MKIGVHFFDHYGLMMIEVVLEGGKDRSLFCKIPVTPRKCRIGRAFKNCR